MGLDEGYKCKNLVHFCYVPRMLSPIPLDWFLLNFSVCFLGILGLRCCNTIIYFWYNPVRTWEEWGKWLGMGYHLSVRDVQLNFLYTSSCVRVNQDHNHFCPQPLGPRAVTKTLNFRTDFWMLTYKWWSKSSWPLYFGNEQEQKLCHFFSK